MITKNRFQIQNNQQHLPSINHNFKSRTVTEFYNKFSSRELKFAQLISFTFREVPQIKHSLSKSHKTVWQ